MSVALLILSLYRVTPGLQAKCQILALPAGLRGSPLAACCLAGLARYKTVGGSKGAPKWPAQTGRGSEPAISPCPSYLAVQTPSLSARRAQKVHSTLEVTTLQVPHPGCLENMQAWSGMHVVCWQAFGCLFLQILIPCHQQQEYWERLNQSWSSSQSPRKQRRKVSQYSRN